MEKLIIDKEIRFALKFKWEQEKDDLPHWINFEGVKIASHRKNDNGLPFDIEFEMGTGANEGKTFEESFEQNKLLDGFIKWDGCMEIHNFNHHWCQQDTFAQRIVDMIYEQAREIIGERFDQ